MKQRKTRKVKKRDIRAQNTVTERYYIIGKGLTGRCFEQASELTEDEWEYADAVYWNLRRLCREGDNWNHKCRCENCKGRKRVKPTFSKRRMSFGVGLSYAFWNKMGFKRVGRFTKNSEATDTHVDLYAIDNRGRLKCHIVPRESVFRDQWATCAEVPRDPIPKALLYVESTRQMRRYSSGGGQKMIKGIKKQSSFDSLKV